MKKTVLKTIAFACLIAMASCGDTNENDSKDVAEDQNEQALNNNMEDDAEFAVNAANGGMMEVELGQLAQSKGTSAEVKQFGEMMATDHAKANEELKALAQQKNITLPATLSEDSRKKVDELSQKSGMDFDKAYIDFMVEDHEEDVDMFQKQADNGNDAEIKSWAAGKVATLQHHLEMAKNAKDALKDK